MWLRHDVGIAARRLSKDRGFTIAAVLTLALGIGATTTIFSVVYGVLLRPLPYRDAERLVVLEGYRTFTGRPATPWNYSHPDLEDWRLRARSLESVALFRNASFAMTSGDESEEIDGAIVSDGFFDVIDGPFVTGRPIAFEERASPVAVISERLWTRRLARSGTILGERIVLDGTPYTIVGVAASTFQLPDDDAEVWVPAVFFDQSTGTPMRRGQGGFNPIARLEPGVTLAQAQADANNVSRELASAYPDSHNGLTATVTPLHTSVTGSVRPALLTLFAAVALLLMVACANVASLIVARGISRAREMAIRVALGASRSQLVRESLIDAGILSGLGCALGAAATYWSIRVLVWLEPSALPRLDAIQVDAPVLVFAVAIAMGTSVVVGLIPVMRLRAGFEALRAGPAASAPGSGGRRVRRVLAVAQLSTALVLLVATALLGRSLVHLMTTDMGVPSDHVAAVLFEVRGGRQLESPELLARLNEAVGRVRAIPGVASVALTSSLPPNLTRFRTTFEFPDTATGSATQYLIDVVTATPEFFPTLRLRLQRGRLFNESDGAGVPLVMLVSAATARRFFGDRDPIGETLPIGDPGPDKRRRDVMIVGVVGDVRYVGLDTPPASTFYLPYAQRPLPNPFLVARTAGDPEEALSSIRSAIARADPGISIVAAETLEGFVGYATAEPRFRTLLLSAIGGLAMVLAAIGVYGVLAYSVVQRTTEIGVRMAIGATRSHVAAMVMREGAALAAVGLAIGIAGAYAVSSLLARFLYGISATDSASFALAATVLLAVSIVATYVPARRATRVDPLIALRFE